MPLVVASRRQQLCTGAAAPLPLLPPASHGFSRFSRTPPPPRPQASKPLHGPNQWPDPALLPRYRQVGACAV